MLTKRRRTDVRSEPSILPFCPKVIELVFGRCQPSVLSMDHVTQSITDLLLSSPRSSMEKATQDNLPNMARWFAAKAIQNRSKSGKSAPVEYREARFLAGVFESAKIGSMELIKAWFAYLPDAVDRATPKIFGVAVREGHVHLLEWLLSEGKFTDELILNAINTQANVVEWMRDRFPTLKLTISFDKMAERWTGPDALVFMQKAWSQRRQFKKIQVTVYAKSMAAVRGDFAMLKWLDTIRKGKCHVWAVRLAGENGHAEIFRWLLENVFSYRAETDSKRWFNWEDEVVTKAVRLGNLEIVKLLRPRDCHQLANMAVKEGHLEMVKWFCEKGEVSREWIRLQEAARRGHFQVVQWLHEHGFKCGSKEIDAAASGGHLHLIKWLLSKGIRCTTAAMDNAARSNHLHIVKWLHNNRSEGCTTDAMDDAASHGWLDIATWLHENRTEGCTARAMWGAADNGHLQVVQWLHQNRSDGCTDHAICRAASGGYFSIVQWLHNHKLGDCKCELMRSAIEFGDLEMAKWIHVNRQEALRNFHMIVAAGRGHLEICKWLVANKFGKISQQNLDDAIRANHLCVVKWLHATDPEQLLQFFCEEGWSDFLWHKRNPEICSRLYSDVLYADVVEWLIPKYPKKVSVGSAIHHLSELAEYPQHPPDVAFAKTQRKCSSL